MQKIRQFLLVVPDKNFNQMNKQTHGEKDKQTKGQMVFHRTFTLWVRKITMFRTAFVGI